MNLKNLFKMAWQTTLAFIGPLVLLTLAYLVMIVVSFGIMAPVATAGYMQSLLRLLREGRSPTLRDLFSEMSFFLPLTGFYFLAMVTAVIGFTFLLLPGVLVVAFFTFSTLYLVPLMTDRRLGLFAALQESWEMAVEDPVMDQVIVVVAFLAITSVGGSVPFGFLVTQPFATILLLGAYEKRRRG